MNALVVSRKQAVQSTIFSIKEDRFAVEVLRGQKIKLIHTVSNSNFFSLLFSRITAKPSNNIEF
jgi:hypothetical protein